MNSSFHIQSHDLYHSRTHSSSPHTGIQIAKDRGATYRLGPELEVTFVDTCLFSYAATKLSRGYGCNDHFAEQDTYVHAMEVLERILASDEARDIVCDIGM